jgi:hypothetical protein
MKWLLDQLDKVPEPVLLVLNALMAGFVWLAHGGALLLTYLKKSPVPPDQVEMIRTMAAFTLPLAGVTALASGVALWRARVRPLCLACQAVVLLGSAAALLAWAVSVLVRGIPEGNFSWSPGLLTGWVTYSTFLFVRYGVPAGWRTPRLRYLPFAVLALSLPVDVGVFFRLLLKMNRLMGLSP